MSNARPLWAGTVESGFVAGVLAALAARVTIVFGLRGLVAGVLAAVATLILVVVALGRLAGNVVIIDAHVHAIP